MEGKRIATHRKKCQTKHDNKLTSLRHQL